jgi:hypothetical protein
LRRSTAAQRAASIEKNGSTEARIPDVTYILLWTLRLVRDHGRERPLSQSGGNLNGNDMTNPEVRDDHNSVPEWNGRAFATADASAVAVVEEGRITLVDETPAPGVSERGREILEALNLLFDSNERSSAFEQEGEQRN